MNFRCFKEATLATNERLVLLIGENDVGKTSVLEAIEILFGARKPQASDLRRHADGETLLEGTIAIPAHREIASELTVNGDCKLLQIRAEIDRQLATSWSVYGQSYGDPTLDYFSNAKASEQKEALSKAGIGRPGSKADERIAQFEQLREEGAFPVTSGWRGLDARAVEALGPKVLRVSASDYSDPETALQSIAADAVQSTVKSTLHAHPQALSLVDGRVQDAASAAVQAVEPDLRRVIPKMKGLSATPSIDFTRPKVSVSIGIDLGSGERYFSEFGQGTRRRAWMAIQHHRLRESNIGPSIRMYDEPDANLHYSAQRSLYGVIKLLAEKQADTQVLVCTHAVTLIDSVSPASIRLIRETDDQGSRIEEIGGGNLAGDVLHTIGAVGRELGLTNLVLLYERAFLLVEGDTEARALPRLYRRLFESEIADDGIRVINMKTCSAWQSVVETLLNTRPGLVHLLLDSDCSRPGSSARLSRERLDTVSIAESDITFVGDVEFEDAFADAAWAGVLNARFPRADGEKWVPEAVSRLRGDKFSTELRNLVSKETRNAVSKPELGEALAEACRPDEVPSSIHSAFNKIRDIANVVPNRPTG